MNRLALWGHVASSKSGRRSGYTLVEILVATVLSMLILGGVAVLFSRVGNTINESRSVLETADRLRTAQLRLQMDLKGLTVTPMPPRKPEFNEGYLEIVEGPIKQTQAGVTGSPTPINVEQNNTFDPSVGDTDDLLQFTTRSPDKPFLGKHLVPDFSDTSQIQSKSEMMESDLAEVSYVVRGNTLYRRVLLVAPGIRVFSQPNKQQPWVEGGPLGYYADNDLSARLVNGVMVPNTLSDLTRRGSRFAHPSSTFPYDHRGWGQFGLPTLRETSLINHTTPSKSWLAGTCYFPTFFLSNVDFWSNVKECRHGDDSLINEEIKNDAKLPSGWTGPKKSSTDNVFERIGEDVLLTNVIGFDVKVWDPLARAYVDLGYNGTLIPTTAFSGFGDIDSLLVGTATTPRIYDTWSTTYANPRTSNGFDDLGQGIVDNDNENRGVTTYGPPPYSTPLRGIQIKIRMFEPDSRQIREVTIVQDFLPK